MKNIVKGPVQGSNRDPAERLEALQTKFQEVLVLGGWKSGSKFGGRAGKILQKASNQANSKRIANEKYHGCQYPEHWDWQAYLVRLKHFVVHSNENLRKAKRPIATTAMIHVWLLNKFSSVSNVGSKSTPKTVKKG